MPKRPSDIAECMVVYKFIEAHPDCRLRDITAAFCWTRSKVFSLLITMDYNGYLISRDDAGHYQVFKRITAKQPKKDLPASPPQDHREHGKRRKYIPNGIRAWRCG